MSCSFLTVLKNLVYFVHNYDKLLGGAQDDIGGSWDSMDSGGTAWRAQTVRQANLSTVFQAVRQGGRVSRSQLVSTTGLTRSAIGGLVVELNELGLVREEAATSDGSPGRPSPVARVDTAQVGALAVEIAVDGLGVAIVGLDGVVVHSRRLARPRTPVPVDETVRDVVALIRELGVRTSVVDNRQLVGVGVAIAGLVDDTTNLVVRAPNLEWAEVGLGHALADALGLDLPVLVANDGDVEALAEVRFGAAVGVADLLYVSGEVGIGGGLFVGGRRVAGRSGFAGEVGHMPINPDGRPCGCGSAGCWETEVGEGVLLARGGRDQDAGIRAVAEMMEAAERGEPTAVAAFAEEARWLGIGMAALIHVFDPELIVLGGFLGRILPVIRQQLHDEIDARVFFGSSRSVRIVAGALGGDAGLIGGAELAFASLVENPLMVRRPSGRID
jgi:predicted NBD/HSP70 family sugar kinase